MSHICHHAELINNKKEEVINTEKVTNKLNVSAAWLKDVPKNDTITFKVYNIYNLVSKRYYCYAMYTIIFRILTQLNWREKEEVWLFPLEVYCNSLIVRLLYISNWSTKRMYLYVACRDGADTPRPLFHLECPKHGSYKPF